MSPCPTEPLGVLVVFCSLQLPYVSDLFFLFAKLRSRIDCYLIKVFCLMWESLATRGLTVRNTLADRPPRAVCRPLNAAKQAIIYLMHGNLLEDASGLLAMAEESRPES